MDIVSLIPQFGNLIYTIIAFVIALSIIVAVHEYGHYIVGKWSGIKADVFSLGFGPVLFSRMDKHGTRWQVAALPFGGYVKFAGDANASGGVDGDAMARMSDEDLRHTMHGAPLWARAATVAAGPVFNFIMSILVFAGIFLFRGQVAEPLTVGDLRPLPVQQTLAEGDVLLAIEGQTLPGFDDPVLFESFMSGLPQVASLAYTVERDGQRTEVTGPFPYPPVAGQVVPRSAAFDAGIEAGDVITAINGQPIYAFDQLRDAVESSGGATLKLDIWRDGAMIEKDLTPRRTDEPQDDNTFRTVYRIGIAGGLFFEPATEALGIWSAVTGGISQTVDIMSGSISGLWHMVTGAISTCNLSGPIGIAETSGAMASQGVTSFIWFIAVLSTAVGLLNLFPVPVLDGGHLVFYAYEAVTGNPPSDKALKVMMSVGRTLILSLMVFALSRDLFCA